MSNLDFKPIWGLRYPDDFNLDPGSIDSAPTLDAKILIDEVLKVDREGLYANPEQHHLSHALMLFSKLSRDTAYDGIDPVSLFASCCDTVLIWSFG